MPTFVSGTVSAGDIATAAQYNNLRTDVVNLPTETYTAAEDFSAFVPACKNLTADEIVNLYFKGEGDSAIFDSGAVDQISAVMVNDNTIAVVYREGAATMEIVAGTVKGRKVTWGTPQELQASGNSNMDIALISTNKVAIVFEVVGRGNCIIATLSGTVFTAGSAVQYSNGTNNVGFNTVCKIDDDKLIVFWDDSTSTDGKAAAATVSGTVPTFGSEVVYETDVILQQSCCQLDTDKAFVAWGDNTNTAGDGRVATVSGTVVSFSAASVAFLSGTLPKLICCSQLATDKAVVTYFDTSLTPDGINARVVSVSGSTPSYGTEALVSDEAVTATTVTNNAPRSMIALSSTVCVNAYIDGTFIYYGTFTISGTTITKGRQVNPRKGQGDFPAVTAVKSGDVDRAMVIFDDDDSTNDGTGFVAALNGNEDKYVGITTAAIAEAATGTVSKRAVLTGLSGLTIGDTLYGDSDVISTTKTPLAVGVVRDTDEVELTHNDFSKLATESPRFSRIQTSRAAGDASGDEVFVFPFEPKLIMFYTYGGNSGSSPNAKSTGSFLSVADQGCVFTTGGGNEDNDPSNVIVSDANGSNKQTATVSAINGSTVTLTWTQGSAGEDAEVEIVAFA